MSNILVKLKFYYLFELLYTTFNYYIYDLFQGNSETYTAAVVEYYPLQDSSLTAKERTNGNVDNYIALLSNVTEDLDIIVFPECTITTGFSSRNRTLLLEHSTLVPSPDENISPCHDSDEYLEYLVKLSCAATNYHTYLAANILEKHSCEGVCAEDGWDVYNTNVVFDRSGTVVARYRKYNLFGEYALNQTSEPEVSTFTTDFNVTFGQFICFDLLFDNPTNVMVRQGIRHFVFSAMWFSEMPFLVAPQSQEQWAYENDVVLLASSANNPSLGSGGSGIYQGQKGAHVVDIIGQGGSKIYTANVTKYSWTNSDENIETEISLEEIDNKALESDNFYLHVDNLTPYTSLPLNTSISTIIEETICNGEEVSLCCNFKIIFETNTTAGDGGHSAYSYRMFVFSGVRSFDGVYNGGIETCGIVACVNETLVSCGGRFSNYSTIVWPVTFQNITIKANYSNVIHKSQYPNSLRSNILPLPVSKIKWTSQEYSNGSIIERTYSLVEPEDRLLTFAIYGRDYSRDSDPLEATQINSFTSRTFDYFSFILFISLAQVYLVV